jgi:hypothetical protein
LKKDVKYVYHVDGANVSKPIVFNENGIPYCPNGHGLMGIKPMNKKIKIGEEAQARCECGHKMLVAIEYPLDYILKARMVRKY